jgi:hypothetical protein
VQEKSPRAASQFISENRNVHKAPKEIIKKAKRDSTAEDGERGRGEDEKPEAGREKETNQDMGREDVTPRGADKEAANS